MPTLAPQAPAAMSPAVFRKFRRLVYEKSGITLGPGKEALVAARIGKRMRELGIQDHRRYLQYVMDDETGNEIVHLLDAISTNVTSFFREADHFEFITRAVTGWLAAGQRRFRFWSAACSSGEEPYSLAMTLLEIPDMRSADVRILATDISTRVLERCRIGRYAPDRIGPVPARLRDRYFDRHRDPGGLTYTVKDELKRLVVFARLNLAEPPFPMRGPMDLVLCRNVMIYFDNQVRARLLAEIYRLLKPGGYLLVGHSESLAGVPTEFQTVAPSIYVKRAN